MLHYYLKTRENMQRILSCKQNLTWILLLSGILSTFGLDAQDANKQSLFNSLTELEKLELVITTDLDHIVGDRSSDEYIDGNFEVYDGKKLISAWDVKLKHRGRFRRKLCDFPPLKLNFDKDQLKDRGLAKFDKFKLVTHCIDDKFAAQENVVREYLAYEMYNLLSPNSYRAVLAKITYVDQNNPRNKVVRYGVLVEPTSELEDRIGAEEVEDLVNPPAEILNSVVENRVSLYQYMIGNEDWSITMMRNLKLFQSKTTGKYILVPYDFDFSGLVNTSYAIPSVDNGLVSVEQRIYLGKPVLESVLAANKKHYQDQKEAIWDLIKSTKKISGEGKIYIRAYLQSFYDELDTLAIPTIADDKDADTIGFNRK
mgnify:CR=1 FL=1